MASNKKATSLRAKTDAVARELEMGEKYKTAQLKILELREYNAQLRSIMMRMGRAADASYKAAGELGEVP